MVDWFIGFASDECGGSVTMLSPCEVTWECTVCPDWSGGGASFSGLCTLVLTDGSGHDMAVRGWVLYHVTAGR